MLTIVIKYAHNRHQVCSQSSSSILIIVIKYAHNRNIGNPNNFKVFRSNKTKGSKQGSKNRLRSPIPEGEEPQFCFQNIHI